MGGDLLLLVPSRGRPANIERLVTAMRETCRADTHLLVGLDQDDIQRNQYEPLLWNNARSVTRPDLHQVVPWLNHLSVPEAANYKYLGHVGDDQGMPTVGWDVKVIEALERVPFTFVDDEYPTREKGTLSCHIFMRSEVVQTLGYFGPPSIRHMFVDVAWMAWGKACGIEFLADVSWPHLHYTLGAPVDASYQASNSWTANDMAAFNAYCHDKEGLNRDVELLGGRPYGPNELAQFKRDLFVPCEKCNG